METIKEYKTIFATKLNHVLDKIGCNPINHGRLREIENITQEKSTTVTNWLVSGKLPRTAKMLAIADSIGVAEDYLFNDDISIYDIRKPEIVKKDGCFLVPVFDEADIFKIKEANIFRVEKRIPLMFPSLENLVQQHGKNIYATKLSKSSFEPQIDKGSTIIYSEKPTFEDYTFVIIKNNFSEPVIRQITFEKGKLKLVKLENDIETIEPLNKNQDAVSIIFNFSE